MTAKAREPAYPVCPHWSWRGGRRPPSEPPASRAAAGATDGRGRCPRTPAPVHSWRSGRTVVVAARIAPADQAAFGERQAHRLPDALEPGHEVLSGLGERWLDDSVGSANHAAAGDIAGRLLHPPRRQVRSLPAGIDRAAGAGWERPRTTEISTSTSSDSGAVDRTIGGGSLPAPLSAQKRRPRFGRMRANRTAANGVRERSRVRGTQLSTQRRGGCLICVRTWPRG